MCRKRVLTAQIERIGKDSVVPCASPVRLDARLICCVELRQKQFCGHVMNALIRVGHVTPVCARQAGHIRQASVSLRCCHERCRQTHLRGAIVLAERRAYHQLHGECSVRSGRDISQQRIPPLPGVWQLQSHEHRVLWQRQKLPNKELTLHLLQALCGGPTVQNGGFVRGIVENEGVRRMAVLAKKLRRLEKLEWMDWTRCVPILVHDKEIAMGQHSAEEASEPGRPATAAIKPTAAVTGVPSEASVSKRQCTFLQIFGNRVV